MWNTFESSAQGRSHIKENVPCQDKTYCLTVDDVTTIALADGAGSARLSHFGAECAVRTISEELCNNFESYWHENKASVAKFRFLQVIQSHLKKKAEELSCTLKDLGSTLLAVSVKGNRFIIFHLGDGVIGYRESNTLKVASAPNNGEFSNTTFFTTSSQAESQTKLIKATSETIDGFILMSDGPEACLYDNKNKSLAKGLLNMFSDAASQAKETVKANINETMQETIVKKTFDDCSIILMAKQKDAQVEGTNIKNEQQNNTEPHKVIEAQVNVVKAEEKESRNTIGKTSMEENHKRNYLLEIFFLAIIIFLIIFLIYGTE